MPDLLLELFSEEIPARMQAGAARDLERLMVGALSDRGLLFEAIKAFAGPRRLMLAITGLPIKQNDVREEVKGPKVDAPPAAIEGFLRKIGLSKEQLRVEKTPKGDVYMAVIARDGRETAAVLAEIIPEVMAKLPWPKSMRWKPGVTTRWVRPLHSILASFDGEVVPFSFAGVSSGLHTHGHRFLSDGRIEARRFDDYEKKLRAAHVLLDADERAAVIFEGVKQAAFVHGLEMIPDEGLLAEVAGLAEWPVILVGAIEDAFMDVPAEILQTSMRTHQKYFSLRDPKTGKMANRFALVANMVAKDGGKEIVAGNERVLRARLSDAKFFWDEDLKLGLEEMGSKLHGVMYHNLIGLLEDRIGRLEALAGAIAEHLNVYIGDAIEAANVMKNDLASGVVSEFPTLQGVMGSYYALAAGMSVEIADAIRDQYKPLGPTDDCPTHPLSIVLSVADKLATVVEFFGVGERPTGSSDPFGIRRAALGVIRIILENEKRLALTPLIDTCIKLNRVNGYIRLHQRYIGATFSKFEDPSLKDDVLGFFADRLKVALKEKGIRHDLIDAVFSLGNEDDLVRLVARVEALQVFLKTDDGANLLAGYKRAANILKAEEKKDGWAFDGAAKESLLAEPADAALHAALAKAVAAIGPKLAAEDFEGAMQQMASLRVPVDAFFEAVKVNADDPALRENRLQLLAGLRAALHRVADFSKIES